MFSSCPDYSEAFRRAGVSLIDENKKKEGKKELGMTLQEAIKSGKPFKRRNWPHYRANTDQIALRNVDILADDWEIEEEKIKLSRLDIDRALKISTTTHKKGGKTISRKLDMKKFFRNLGFTGE